MLVSIVSLVVLTCFLYYSRPKEVINRNLSLYWSDWAKKLSILQAMLVIVIMVSPTFLTFSFWVRTASLADFLFSPFNTLLVADLASQVYLVSCVIIPLFFGLLVYGKLGRPLNWGKSLDNKIYDSIFSIGLSLLVFILVLASIMTFMYGTQILYFATPVFSGLFIASIFPTRLASVRYVPPTITKKKQKILYAVCGLAVLLPFLTVIVGSLTYSGLLASSGYDLVTLATGGLTRAFWMTCLIGVPITLFLILNKIVSLRKPKKSNIDLSLHSP